MDDMGNWKRSGFSRDIKPGKVTVAGWVQDVRLLGKINFFLIRDREGVIQVTAKKGECKPELIEKIKALKNEDVVAVRGQAKNSKIAKLGLEVFPEEIRVLNRAGVLPLDPTGKTPAELDTRLNARVVDLRKPEVLAIFRIRNQVLRGVREWFDNEGYFEVTTPRLIKEGAEGGATLFEAKYFGQAAYLSQSPQLYKEHLTAAFEKVYEIGNFFRAEPSDTSRHIAEFTGIDTEVAFADEGEAMKDLENMFYAAVQGVRKNCADELEVLKQKIEVTKPPYKRVTYEQALKKMEKGLKRLRWGEDIDPEGERLLGDLIKGPFFIVKYPTELKPFYIKPDSEDLKVCRSFDFDFGGIEIASGGQRIHSRKELEGSMTKHGYDAAKFEAHLGAFDWGMPPHAGWGLGLERLVMVLAGKHNIREAVLYPRDLKRLLP